MRKRDEQLRIEKVALPCPLTGCQVQCDLAKADDTILEVVRCSAFPPDEPIACDKACVRMLNRGWEIESDGDG